ncbi:MAG TPA: hypothetical protein EYN06_02815 [Myxococcales bacterium]|nr:hypothetical protein [Myxococcales bacterium]HIN85386.1 hypothetical protein [Myxococcales bacterium]
MSDLSKRFQLVFIVSLLCTVACNKKATPGEAATPTQSAAKVEKKVQKAAPKAPVPAEECTIKSPLKAGVPGSPGNLIASKINPNGDSELSDLMRKMLADMRVVRNGVMNGQTDSKIPISHERMVCTWPTDESTRNPLYAAMANKYMGTVRDFNKAGNADLKRFNAVIDSCAACHEQSCRGPLVVINPLKLSP